jgi:UDP-N-acetylglucosamine 2-epimerase (hydrolysing)
MFSEDLPNIDDVKKYYEIPFENFAIVMFPVTTEATATYVQKNILQTVSIIISWFIPTTI